ncbi:hypothetical protein KM043_006033 [Ampulex compressa]|nr:hypothetical protein KM043_006033 [Ampulex compressa]
MSRLFGASNQWSTKSSAKRGSSPCKHLEKTTLGCLHGYLLVPLALKDPRVLGQTASVVAALGATETNWGAAKKPGSRVLGSGEGSAVGS